MVRLSFIDIMLEISPGIPFLYFTNENTSFLDILYQRFSGKPEISPLTKSAF